MGKDYIRNCGTVGGPHVEKIAESGMTIQEQGE